MVSCIIAVSPHLGVAVVGQADRHSSGRSSGLSGQLVWQSAHSRAPGGGQGAHFSARAPSDGTCHVLKDIVMSFQLE